MKTTELAELIDRFQGAVGGIGSNAPDEYPDWSYRTYESEKAEIAEIWPEIRAALASDSHTIAFIEEKLAESFAHFEAGRTELGRAAMWAIYNKKVGALV
jgi:hypothetical protein